MEQLLREAISSIKSGNISRGRQLIVRILENDEKNETAWLWLTKCLTNPQQKRECFERVLEINPNNQNAKDGLKRLDTLSKIKEQPSAESKTPQTKTPKKKGSSSTRKIILVLIIVLVLLCLVVSLVPDPDEASTEASPSQASTMCENIVESQLVAPSTAKFASYDKQQIWILGKDSGTYENAFRVRGYVDAQNSFGAQIRTYYTCDISYDGGEWYDLRNWTLLDLNIEN